MFINIRATLSCILHETYWELNGGGGNLPWLYGKESGGGDGNILQSWLSSNLQTVRLQSHTIVYALVLLVSKSATNNVLEGPVVQLEWDARGWFPFLQQLLGWNLTHSRQNHELFTLNFHDLSVTRMGHLSGCNSTSFLLFHLPTDGQEWEPTLGRHFSPVGGGLWATCVCSLDRSIAVGV